ncbi:hypothetical protein LP316_09330 [Thalassotalea sp. LPB0316]|uniref:DUF6445 family protein n=1 Tax=Thalassotalea sp. LPB0316 TaxID=2769490 RepID=UPI001867BE6D|nr:DUF6445 family protein [Thalassotalea sp. LPB0316]QOL24560.1 hypothetical protein LP316_09330 [Thalassotalea sp. LPB0316]
MAQRLSLDNGITMTIVRVGIENTPVVIIDNFPISAQKPTTLDNFAPDEHSYYPGLRAKLPKEYVIKALQSIYLALYDIYQIPKNKQLKVLDTYYSMITLDESELSLLQRLPHFDSTHEHYFAVLHYLNEQPHGGTGLFRHKATGFESIDDQRIEHYLSICQQEIEDFGEPKQGYPNQSTAQFDCYYQIEYKANRVVIYPGKLLHSTMVDVDKDVTSQLELARLTSNIFIEYK